MGGVVPVPGDRQQSGAVGTGGRHAGTVVQVRRRGAKTGESTQQPETLIAEKSATSSLLRFFGHFVLFTAPWSAANLRLLDYSLLFCPVFVLAHH